MADVISDKTAGEFLEKMDEHPWFTALGLTTAFGAASAGSGFMSSMLFSNGSFGMGVLSGLFSLAMGATAIAPIVDCIKGNVQQAFPENDDLPDGPKM